MHVVVFQVNQQGYGVPLEHVACVVPAVAITPVPQAPRTTLGVINVHGTVMPVTSARRLFGQPDRDVCPADQMIVMAKPSAHVLLVDGVTAIVEYTPDDVTPPEPAMQPHGLISGILRHNHELILLHT